MCRNYRIGEEDKMITQITAISIDIIGGSTLEEVAQNNHMTLEEVNLLIETLKEVNSGLYDRVQEILKK